MDKKILIYIIAGLLVLALVVMTLFPGMIIALKDREKSGDDLCKPGQGYTEESWREHMSHHPDVYEECLT